MYVLQRVVREGETFRFEDIPGEAYESYEMARFTRWYNHDLRHGKEVVVIITRDEEHPESASIDLAKMTQAEKEEWVISSLAALIDANERKALSTGKAIQIILQEGCRISMRKG